MAKNLGFPVVEPDAIRMVIHGGPWRKNIEPLVWAHAHVMVEALFEAGHSDVILDATNHTFRRRLEWEDGRWRVQIHEVPTSPEICRERAIATKQEYLLPVIDRMARDYQPPGGHQDG